MWIPYDHTLATWLDKGDMILYDGMVLEVAYVVDEEDGLCRIYGTDEWDNEDYIVVRYDANINLVKWEEAA